MMIKIEDIFKNVNFTSCGGTENLVRELYANVDCDLLNRFDWLVSYPNHEYIRGSNPSILWIHDNSNDRYFEPLQYRDFLDQFTAIVFVSHLQAQSFRDRYNIPYSKSFVLKNAINPNHANFEKFDDLSKIKIVYSSMPHKGLAIAFEVFKVIKEEYGDAVNLSIFSNYSVYGEHHLHRNEQYQNIFNELESGCGINYRSAKREDVLRELSESHIWTLPSVFAESSCVSAMEAMSSGCVCVCNDFGALPETTSGYAMLYHYDEDINRNAGAFYECLKTSIETIKSNPCGSKHHVTMQKVYADANYSWDRRKREWQMFLEGAKNV